MYQERRFADTLEISSVKTGISTMGEILTFKEKDIIIATINRSARVTLRWKEHANLYVGSLGGVEFSSPGPESFPYMTTR